MIIGDSSRTRSALFILFHLFDTIGSNRFNDTNDYYQSIYSLSNDFSIVERRKLATIRLVTQRRVLFMRGKNSVLAMGYGLWAGPGFAWVSAACV